MSDVYYKPAIISNNGTGSLLALPPFNMKWKFGHSQRVDKMEITNKDGALVLGINAAPTRIQVSGEIWGFVKNAQGFYTADAATLRAENAWAIYHEIRLAILKQKFWICEWTNQVYKDCTGNITADTMDGQPDYHLSYSLEVEANTPGPDATILAEPGTSPFL